MQTHLIFLLFLSLACVASATPAVEYRHLFGWFGGNKGPTCNGCPYRHCVDDPAVFLGYCCGCARVSDYLPIDCPNHLNCPADGRRLCRDYDYMLNCCC